ncbi:LOW QUALITY PROTEIN: ubiquitin carboxyl-terminal hydrolase 26 [Molossus nigricans]
MAGQEFGSERFKKSKGINCQRMLSIEELLERTAQYMLTSFVSLRALTTIPSMERTLRKSVHSIEQILNKYSMTKKINVKEGDPEWDKTQVIFDFYPAKLFQAPNLTNTCYNAVLQFLFPVSSFAYDLLCQGFPCNKIPFDALSMCLLHLLVLKNISSIKINKLLVNIKHILSTIAEFSDNTQNDAHEVLGHCLDQMKENMKSEIIWKTKIESTEENSPQHFADDAVTKLLVCPVITNFEIQLLHSIICKVCGQVILKTSVNCLFVNLPGTKTHPLSIQSTFDLFFRAEELEYKCGKCNHKTSVSMQKFSRLPRVLIVHLKYYSFKEFWSLRKDDQEVIVSKYLKLSSHCNESTKPLPSLNKNVHIKDSEFLTFFQKINSKILRSLTPSTK